MTDNKDQISTVAFTEKMIPEHLNKKLHITVVLLGVFNYLGINFLLACTNEISEQLDSTAHSAAILA